MKQLDYPFDCSYLLSKKKKLKEELLSDGTLRTEKRIAVLGGYTTSNILLMLELFLLNQGIAPVFYESEFDQYYQDAMFPNAALEKFKPDIIYICTSNRNVLRYPELTDEKNTVGQLLHEEYYKFSGMWERLAKVYHCPVIQNNMEMPFYRLMGNKEVSDIHGKVNFLTRLNMMFCEYAQTHKNFYLCDVNYISADYGLKDWSDPFYWYMYKYAVNINAIPYLSFNVANIIKSIFGKNKKGFVLDLDNTLWGGVIGEDGVDHIALGPEDSKGQAYLEFQRYLKEHKQLGLILNINSKNDEENAKKGLEHPDSELKPDDFIVIKANWESKDRNFKQIAEELNLLPESLVFVDDNPAERHIVTEQLKGVSAPELNQVRHFIQILDRSGFFEATTLSADDSIRNEMYKENIRRQELKAEFSDYHEYLLNLEMKAEIKPFEPVYMARISQLTNKSNQFNLTTKRYTQSEIEAVAARDNYITIYGKLADRFGDNGVVSVVIGRIDNCVCHIDLWIMSCRVLKRDLEFAMMDRLVRQCKKKGIKKIAGYYYPTEKNRMVKDFYGLQGFEKIEEDSQGNTIWNYTIPEEYKNKQDVIHVQ
jgi:FkbH-like protein